MIFDTDAGKSATISLNHCKEDLTAQDVDGAMDMMIDNPVFIFGLTDKQRASVVERTVTDLF
jgi:hypothetical protein